MSRRSASSVRVRTLALAAVLASALAAGCGSTSAATGTSASAELAPGATNGAAAGGTPDAVPLTKILNEKARAASEADPVPDANSESRVLAYVNGDVVNYRDVLHEAGPQIAAVGSEEERRREEERALVAIIRERIVHRAAVDAGIDITRDELEKERASFVRELEKNGGTFEAYLAQHTMSRREHDEQIRRRIRIRRYMQAAMGTSVGAVRVRAVTDTFPSPREIRAYYDRNAEKFVQPEMGRVRVLAVPADLARDDREAALADAQRRAEAALARLRAGEDFVPVYRDVNRGAKEPDPTDGLYEIAPEDRGRVADWITNFAYEKPRGTLSDVERKGSTFYVLRAEGYEPSRTLPYEEVQQRIQSVLGQMKRGVASFEVELSLLEEAAVTPRDRYDLVRDYLINARRRLISEAGL